MIRLFAAVEIDAAVRAAAEEASRILKERLRKTRLDARWVAADNLHFTLAFIGHVEDRTAQSFAAALREPVRQPPFTLRLGGCGCFPLSGAPRVIWIGVAEGADGLRALHGEVLRRLTPLGFEPEARPFSAHLTVARVKDVPRGAAREAREAIAHVDVADAACLVTRVTLFRSHLSPKGSRYEALAHGELGHGS
jgi:2'-5' RNA ligase